MASRLRFYHELGQILYLPFLRELPIYRPEIGLDALRMSNEKNKTWLPIILIAVAILTWMSILAAGAYWAPNGDGEGGDIRKLWVVAGTTGIFFLFWGFVLYRVQVKIRRKRGPAGSSDS